RRRSEGDPNTPPPPRIPRGPGKVQTLITLGLAVLIIYGGYFWLIRRVVVGPNEVLVLLKKDGWRSLPADEIIIPRMPEKSDPRYAAWKERYDGCNGIVEEVYPAGTYFKFSPFDYEREIVDVSTSAAVPNDKVGIVIKKFGQKLDDGQILADPARDQRG